jgi:hypothetical protein
MSSTQPGTLQRRAEVIAATGRLPGRSTDALIARMTLVNQALRESRAISALRTTPHN